MCLTQLFLQYLEPILHSNEELKIPHPCIVFPTKNYKMYHLTLRRSINALAGRSSICNGSVNNGTRRGISSHIKCSSTTKTSTSLCPVITSASLLVAAAGLYTADNNFNSNAVAQCNAKGAEPVMLSPT